MIATIKLTLTRSSLKVRPNGAVDVFHYELAVVRRCLSWVLRYIAAGNIPGGLRDASLPARKRKRPTTTTNETCH